MKVEPVRGVPHPGAINCEPPSMFGSITLKAEPVDELTPKAEVVPMPSLAELSDAEKAMMDSLTNREKYTKDKKNAAKAAGSNGDCGVMKKHGSAVMKKPGSATPSKASSAIKRPAGFAGSSKPSMPTSHGSVDYKGGKIYTQWAKKKFRAIKDVMIPSKEKHLKWKSAKPTKEEWDTCVNSVDDYWK